MPWLSVCSDQPIRIAIHDQAGQQIAFAMHHAIGIRIAHHAAPMGFGRGQAAREELAADLFARRATASARRSAKRR